MISCYKTPNKLWCLEEEGYRPEKTKHYEGLLTQGSQGLHLRASYEEGLAAAPQDESYMRLPANVTVEKPRHPRSKAGCYIPGVTGIHPLLNEVVVNQFLAAQNQWEIGNTITFQTNSGMSMQAIISGYYLSGTERNQAKEMSAVYRIENTIYGKPELITQIQDISGYESVSVYLKDPESMEAVGQSIAGILGDKAELTKSDTLFQQMKQPLEQAIRIVQLMQYLTIGTGMIVVTLLLCMWMRSRKKEVAVYISLGERKSSIFMQMMLESLLVFVVSTLFAVVAGNFLAKWLKTILFAGKDSIEALQISIQSIDIGLLAAVGGGILLFAVGISLIPVLEKNPKDTLSEMEG